MRRIFLIYSEVSCKELKTKTAKAVLSILQGERPGVVVNPEILKNFCEVIYEYQHLLKQTNHG